MIRTEHLCKSFGELMVLKDVTLTLAYSEKNGNLEFVFERARVKAFNIAMKMAKTDCWLR